MNFSYVPLPDSVDDVSSNGNTCAYGDQVEACALDLTGCLGDGCTGEALMKLSSFVSCFEKSWVEMMCVGAKTKASTCAESSGIDSDKLSACLNDSSKVKQLEQELNNMDPGNLRQYPTVHIGTFFFFNSLTYSLSFILSLSHTRAFFSLLSGKKDESEQSQTPSDLKKALCSQGVSAAC